MPIPHSLTKDEALRQIAELQRHIDSLPQNNHPPEIQRGMLFKDKRDGDLFIAIVSQHKGSQDLRLACVSGSWIGKYWHAEYLMDDNGRQHLEYLGHAKDLLTLKQEVTTNKPEVVVTDEMAIKAWNAYDDFDGSNIESMKHALTLALNGKL